MISIATKQDNTAGATGRVSAAEINSVNTELENAVIRSGQTLDDTGVNLEQVAEGMTIAGGAASSFVDSGTANTIVLTPSTGQNGLKIPTDYARFNGFQIRFFAAASNTGATTINIGQTSGTLLGSKKLLQPSGAELTTGTIISGRQVIATYDPNADSATGAWIIDESLLSNVPTGAIFQWSLDTIPLGYLAVEGQSLSRTTYLALFNIIGTSYGNVDANTFNLPDYRGLFLRGWDNSAGNDPDSASRTDRGDGTTGDNVGTNQSDAMQRMTGSFGSDGWRSNALFGTGPFTLSNTGAVAPALNTNPGSQVDFDSANSISPNTAKTSDYESRPANITVRFIIKY